MEQEVNVSLKYNDVVEHLEKAETAMRDKLGGYNDPGFHRKHMLILSIAMLKSRVKEMEGDEKHET